jgi:aspartate racemase
MKSVGIIGGLGPETTAQFYLEILFRCQKLNGTQRPSVVIGSVPLEFEIEQDLILRNQGIDRYIPFLIEQAKQLERSGVDFIVMPCNSLHVFIDVIRESVTIPVLSIVEETIKYLQRNNLEKIGLISTSTTLLHKVYETKLNESNIGFVSPDEDEIGNVNQIIERLVSGNHRQEDKDHLVYVAEALASKGAQAVALACTDLQLLKPLSDKVTIFDTMKVLADSTVDYILTK